MKHTLKITFLLILIFFTAQVVGLAIIGKYVHVEEYIDPATSLPVKEVIAKDLPYSLERPQIEQSSSYIWITAAILIGTALLLILIRLGKIGWWFWKLWFFLAVFLTMAVAFSAFIQQQIALLLAFALAAIKVYKPTPIVQNFTEVFIYGGLAAIFVPVINIFAAFMLLIIISIYDIIAVRHTKHMVKLAKFQAKTNVFAGLFMPYGHKAISPQAKGILHDKEKGRIAVLGGGDIGFPLLFAGVVLKGLMLENLFPLGFLKSLIVPVFAAIALSYLLVKGGKDKFYPAMPYISAGCFLGYLIVFMLM
ncbi:MAG: presenilin family intramembrane aspartyl protease [Nanoarchaeota archaeon]